MRARAALAAGLLVAALAGCTSSDGLAGTGDYGYISGDGSVLQIPPVERGDPVGFGGETTDGDRIDSADLDGVVVLNFWYASCPPCREEADELEELAERFAGEVTFLGVNVRDQAATARAFIDEFGVSFPSILDAGTRDVVRAFAGDVPPAAVPTTLVLDAQGRVAVRITGIIPGVGTVAELIDAVLGEDA